MKRVLQTVAVGLTFAICGTPAIAAQSDAANASAYPDRPIHWIVPFPPGGAQDIIAHVIGKRVAKDWGEKVIVEFFPGAGGNLGTAVAARKKPDGYTVVSVGPEFATYTNLYRKPLYHPLKDFVPVTLLSTAPFVLVVNPVLPAKTVKALVALAKAKPRAVDAATTGIGAGADLALDLFKNATHVHILKVPYKGMTPAVMSVIEGQDEMMFANGPSALAHIKSAQVRALAVTSATRWTSFPKIPTMGESGVHGVVVDQWTALMAPAHTPHAIVNKLQGEVVKALKVPAVRQRLTKLGFEPVGDTRHALLTYLEQQKHKWAEVIKANHIHRR